MVGWWPIFIWWKVAFYRKQWLVGGIPTPLKNMSSSAGMMKFPTEWKVIKFHGSKPPTSIYIIYIYIHIPLNPIKSSFLLVKSLSIVFTTRKPGGSGRFSLVTQGPPPGGAQLLAEDISIFWWHRMVVTPQFVGYIGNIVYIYIYISLSLYIYICMHIYNIHIHT